MENFNIKAPTENFFFIEPTIIKTDGKSLYVIDSGNYQLKILSKDFDLIETINLPQKDPGLKCWDMEIINGRVYLSLSSMFKEYTAVYELSKNGVLRKMKKEFIGYISNFNAELMVVNSLETYKKSEHGIEIIGGKSGKNKLYSEKDDNFKKEFDFVDKYAPLDFILIDNFIYVVSAANTSLDKFTTDGQYIETVLKFDETHLFVQLESVDDGILVVVPPEKAIYKVDIQ